MDTQAETSPGRRLRGVFPNAYFPNAAEVERNVWEFRTTVCLERTPEWRNQSLLDYPVYRPTCCSNVSVRAHGLPGHHAQLGHPLRIDGMSALDLAFPGSAMRTLSMSCACCSVPRRPASSRASSFISRFGSQQSIGPGSSDISWPRFHSRPLSARRSQDRCSICMEASAWRGGSGFSSSKRLPAVVLAVVLFFYLTDRPEEADWLARDEREWLSHRLSIERRNREAVHGLRGSVRSARDQPKSGLFRAVAINYGLSFFLPQIAKAFGLNTFLTTLVSAAPYLSA